MSDLRLDERIPDLGFDSPDDALDCLLTWITDRGLSPYAHQEEAMLELFSSSHVVLDTPTGSGKSLVAIALHFKTFSELGRTWYTAPIKALVSEKFFALCDVFGAEHVGMMTGDGAINRDAPILCCTAEVLANIALREGHEAKVDSVVMDEFHYYANRDRGMAWQIPLLTLPQTQFLLMSATLGDTTRIRKDLEERTGRPAALVDSAHRPVPLEFEYAMTPVHESIDRLVRGGKAPLYVVHFSQREASEQAQALMSVNYASSEDKDALAKEVKGFRFDSPFGKYIQRYVRHGVGLHHAGLLPRYRLLVEKLAQQGLLRVICGTDTLGVGINVPIRSVLFTKLCKFDGQSVDVLTRRDFKQIAGRAGRAGFDTMGTVVAQAPAHVIDNARLDAKKKKKKVRKAQPPTRGYKHWDEDIFQQLVQRPPERLKSRFQVDHGILLTVMQHAQDVSGDARKGVDDLLALVEQSHATAKDRARLTEEIGTLLDGLQRAGIVHDGEDDTLVLDPDLQRDFSLYHSLSLFLVEALSTLDPASDSFHLDLISWVEAILDDPRPVLLRQAHRERGRVVGELKARGVPYEERMELLDEITWPRPLAEEIFALFNAYAEHHPWVTGEAIRPKSVVRELVEGFRSFGDYVSELGVQHSEGVLLRYVTEAYKAIVQNVPANLWSDELLAALAYLRALLARVDSSLITEWELLVAGSDAPVAEGLVALDISRDTRAFKARLRAELHALVEALARGDWEEAAACIRQDEEQTWAAEALEEALAPFVEEHDGIAFDHRARLGVHTRITPDGPHQWAVRQVLVPVLGEGVYGDVDATGFEDLEEGEAAEAWSIEGRVDLRSDTNPDGPLVEVMAIGP